MMMISSFTYVLLLLVCFSGRPAEGKIYFLLQNKAPKCFQVTAPSDVRLLIHYDAPDLILVQDDGQVDMGSQKQALNPEDGMDAQYNERFQKRIETLKRANLKDIHVSITPRDAAGGVIIDRSKTEENTQIPEKIRQPLEQRTGMMEYETRQLNYGSIEFCMQSYTASAETPSRVSLVVEQESERQVIEREIAAERKLMGENLLQENALVKAETSRITAELMRMHRRSKAIAGDASYSMDREASFQQQSIVLNQAVKYWPMFRMFILLVAGYVQVSNVVGYMKKKHIC